MYITLASRTVLALHIRLLDLSSQTVKMSSQFASFLAWWSSTSHHLTTLFFTVSLLILSLNLGLQQPPYSLTRRALTAAFLSAAVVTMKLSSMALIPWSSLLVAFVLAETLQGICLLAIEGSEVIFKPQSVPLPRRLRAIYRVFTDFRQLSLDTINSAPIDAGSRVEFALFRGSRGLVILLAYSYGKTILFERALIALQVFPWDFGVGNQGSLPMSLWDVGLRSVVSVSWIWSTYAQLCVSHDLLAVLFVSVLGWDQPEEWPPLFGNITDATSLRRFWGVFWHKLHVSVFDRYMSHTVDAMHQLWPGTTCKHLMIVQNHRVFQKAARALGMFLMSAACHAACNWVQIGRTNASGELWFFFMNWLVCLLEGIADQLIVKRISPKRSSQMALWRMLLGYMWVIWVLLCLTPAWQYPIILAAVGWE
jgi:hypothetical protein